MTEKYPLLVDRILFDLTGESFGRLKVLERAGSNDWRQALWLCKCICGEKKIVSGSGLRAGKCRSCGCLQPEAVSKAAKKHGMAKSVEYEAWCGMRARCENKKSKRFKDYGGRGISVCKRWGKFAPFFEDMGFRPGAKFSIDRINNDGNYEPSNCRWATTKQQAQNKRQGKKPIGWKWQRPRINGLFVQIEREVEE